jgi:glycosyltransferase involved in cell wall biosynthesis
MNILFVHNNFPAQYRHVVRALASDPSVQITAIGSSSAKTVDGVRLLNYELGEFDVASTHPFARRFEVECRRAEQVLYALSSLASTGFRPDVIMAHPGWGETLPLRTMFPAARILLYCEFFYGAPGRDVGFDTEFPDTGTDGRVALHLKNAASLLALVDCDLGITPTKWQHSTFPSEYRNKIAILHDGIDVDLFKPNPNAVVRLSSGHEFRCTDEVVTFVARNLEPLRGYHIFMRALPRIMARRPQAQIVIIGGDAVSYGAAPPGKVTWKSLFHDEVADRIDARRVHFTGRLSYRDYLKTLQVSSAHVYLTYPFVLSWSFLEALSTGCVVVGSDTPPVREVLDGANGVLVPFFDVEQLADRVVDALASPSRYRCMRTQARQTVVDRYDLTRRCLPKVLALIKDMAGQGASRTRQPGKVPGRQHLIR